MPSDPLVNRRELLRTIGATSPIAVAGCTTRTGPTIAVPGTALTDEPVRIELDGLGSASTAVVRASARSRDGEEWAARARFDVPDTGSLVVGERAPDAGSYEGADPMGPFWSKRPAGADPGEPLPPEVLFVPHREGYDVTITAEVDGETAAETTTTRRLYDPGIDERPVDHDAVVGDLFLPPDDGPAPGVVHLHGAGGRPHRATGRLLASRGFAALTLRYFGDPDPLPDGLVEVPVEYVGTAVEWLRARERVAGPAIGLVGFSRGGSLALLAGSRIDGVGAVVGWVPSGIAWEGLDPDRTPAGTSAWSVGGEPVPYLEMAEADPGPPPTPGLPYFEPALSAASEDDLAAASIPVERADAPILLESVTDDRRWPSTDLCERVVARLRERDYPHRRRHDSHGGAGHFLRFPYLPTAGTARDARNVYGGNQVAKAVAGRRVWNETVAFLRDALAG